MYELSGALYIIKSIQLRCSFQNQCLVLMRFLNHPQPHQHQLHHQFCIAPDNGPIHLWRLGGPLIQVMRHGSFVA
jgi:hypothetical protein